MLIFLLFTCILFILGTNIFMGFSLNICNFSSFSVNYSLGIGGSYCLLMLFLCVLLSITFSLHYFSWHFNYLNSLIILFVCVMVYLVSSNNLFNTLVGWEYLGFVSFILILFYSTYDTVKASNTTLISSRFGDVGLFLLIGLISNYLEFPTFFLIVFLFLIIGTKSACLPFTSWLLEAMRAPTPVSCLVHSSTLVAAGVWFLSSYGYLLAGTGGVYLLIPCFITILSSSVSSLFFLDIKKLVALSTCNNISWCLVYYILGFSELCLIQLFSHGVAKCMLFCAVGDLLASSSSNQINSGQFSSLNQNEFSSFIPCLLILFVSGLPFQGVFFSKHILLSYNSFSQNPILLVTLYTCVLLTYLYSFRLFGLVSNIFSGQSSGFQASFFFLGGLVLTGCLFNFHLCSCIEEPTQLPFLLSVLVIISQVAGLLGGWWFNDNRGRYYSSTLYGQDVMINGFSSLFILLSNSLFYVSNFRTERYFSNFLSNANLYSISLSGIIQINIFFCFMLLFALIFLL
uniref:NADH dehydrogenase subunit 5 n=1 Tax=Capsala martinieri TaxID=119074 RepID=UPI002008EED8|nr:NADH dehydrogenase subunit 5 [Capsala martinieri]UOX29716.1 NADH dehydrogenase subunit 5 [Capsala martinieri]